MRKAISPSCNTNFKLVSQELDNIQIVIEMNEKVSRESNTLGTHGPSMQCESMKTN